MGEGFECVLSRSASGREKCYEAVLFLLAECVLPLALYSFEYISGNLRIGFCVYLIIFTIIWCINGVTFGQKQQCSDWFVCSSLHPVQKLVLVCGAS